jgi:hypothetical protein
VLSEDAKSETEEKILTISPTIVSTFFEGRGRQKRSTTEM